MCAHVRVCTPVPGGEAADWLKADPPGQTPGPSRVVCAQGQTGPRGLAHNSEGAVAQVLGSWRTAGRPPTPSPQAASPALGHQDPGPQVSFLHGPPCFPGCRLPATCVSIFVTSQPLADGVYPETGLVCLVTNRWASWSSSG